MMTTTQAADIIAGGLKVNALVSTCEILSAHHPDISPARGCESGRQPPSKRRLECSGIGAADHQDPPPRRQVVQPHLGWI